MPEISKKISKGFTFIELTVAIIIIGIMATVVVPRIFRRRAPMGETFVIEFNDLVQAGVLNAMKNGRLHRVLFDFENDIVRLQMAKRHNASAEDASEEFLPVFLLYGTSTVNWPADLEMRHFYIGKDDEMLGGTKKRIWFFIGPDGTIQDVTAIIFDVERRRTFSLATNPFTAQLTVYNGSKKPE